MAKKLNNVSNWPDEEQEALQNKAVEAANAANGIVSAPNAPLNTVANNTVNNVSNFAGNGLLNIRTQVESGGAPQQLPPIIQPIAFVPYSTTRQPLYQYADDGEYGYDYNGYEDVSDAASYSMEEEPAYEERAERVNKSGKQGAKKVNMRKSQRVNASGCSIVLMILSILSLLVIILGAYVKFEYLYVYKEVGALTKILELKDMFGGEIVIKTLLFPASIALVAVADILIFLGALISVKKRGVGGLTKFFILLEVLGAALFAVMVAVNGFSIGYGTYIIAGIALVSMLFALFSRK